MGFQLSLFGQLALIDNAVIASISASAPQSAEGRRTPPRQTAMRAGPRLRLRKDIFPIRFFGRPPGEKSVASLSRRGQCPSFHAAEMHAQNMPTSF